jgi:hypothetical protein
VLVAVVVVLWQAVSAARQTAVASVLCGMLVPTIQVNPGFLAMLRRMYVL